MHRREGQRHVRIHNDTDRRSALALGWIRLPFYGAIMRALIIAVSLMSIYLTPAVQAAA
jgi:hypothetical protein